MDADDLEDLIDEVAAGPAAASNANGSVSEHNLKDLMALDKHKAAKRAAANGSLGIVLRQVNPPSALG